MNDNTRFIPPPFANHSPKTWYQSAAQQPGFIHDTAQEKAIEHLDRLWTDLMMFKRKRNRFLGRSLRSPQVPTGLYFYGGVGRGKSFLMDAFYGCLPYRRKRRIHFHAFMAEIHQRLHEKKNEPDPLKFVAKEIATETRVLCFDEFHVSDIADAMILGRLLENLFKEGVVLIATSNYAPSELYPKGQNRSNFLSTIKLIEETLTILNVDGGEDYRMRVLQPAEIYYIPNDDNANQQLTQLFTELSFNKDSLPIDIIILDRKISCIKHANQIIWFDFRTLCFGNRSQADYLWLAQNYTHIIISDIEKMSPDDKNAARRLTLLIDILYDYRVKLCLSAEVAIDKLYTEGDFAQEFTRTASRLNEMQSCDYLALPHLTIKDN